MKKDEKAKIALIGVYSDGTKRDLTLECDVYSDDENIAYVKGNTVYGVGVGETELWFGSVPSANIKYPGMINVIVK